MQVNIVGVYHYRRSVNTVMAIYGYALMAVPLLLMLIDWSEGTFILFISWFLLTNLILAPIVLGQLNRKILLLEDRICYVNWLNRVQFCIEICDIIALTIHPGTGDDLTWYYVSDKKRTIPWNCDLSAVDDLVAALAERCPHLQWVETREMS